MMLPHGNAVAKKRITYLHLKQDTGQVEVQL